MKNPFLLILASAGSGKTHRLVNQFLTIVHQEIKHNRPEAVQRILAATFTRAAAAEIIERVLERVAHAIGDPKQLAELCKQIDPSITVNDCGKILQALMRNLHRLRIGTLDSFIVQSAQSFSPELGLPTPWSIVDDLHDNELRFGAIDELLEAATDDPEKFAEMLELLVMLNQQKYPLRVRQTLLDRFGETYSAFISAGPAAWEVIDGDETKLLGDAKINDLCTTLPGILDQYVPPNADGSRPKNWLKAIASLYDNLSAKDWDAVAANGFIPKILCGEDKFSGKPMSRPFKAALVPLVDHLRASFLCKLHHENIATRDLLQQFDAGYRAAKLKKSSWRFDDFPRLLNEAEITTGLDEFYFRLDGRIDHILLDEFQDTSIAQWRLLRPMVQEIMSGDGAGDGPRSFFCVGDVKQTLYGWRNAEPELVDRLRDDWPELKQQPLDMSYRSCQVIIDSVNRVFGTLANNPAMSEGDLGVAATKWASWYSAHTTTAKLQETPGFCRLITCGTGEQVADRQRRALKLAAQRVLRISGNLPNAKIAVLMRRKKFVGRMVHELKRLDISASGEGGSPLIDDPAVCAALSVLHLLDHPCDSAALYHVSHSPLGAVIGLTAESANPLPLLKITREIRGEILDRGLASVLNDWLTKSAGGFGPRNFARYQRMVELAHDYPYDGGEYGPFLDFIRQTSIEDPSVERIRVMTIHASKGRQFDVVILPDLDDYLLRNPPQILSSRKDLLEPYCCVTIKPKAQVFAFDERLRDMRAAADQRKIVEELCALYVAMTRAEMGLEMIVHPTEKETLPGTMAGILRGALLGAQPAPAEQQLWQHEKSKYRRKDAELNELTPPEMVELKLAPAKSPRLPPVVSPSGLEGGGFIQLKNYLSFSDAPSFDRGTVLHRWFELVGWLDEAMPSRAEMIEGIADLNVTADQINALMEEFSAAYARPAISAILRRSAYTSFGPDVKLELWRERRFAVRLDGVILQGQLDRVVVVRDASGKAIAADLIDYKSDRISAEEDSLGKRVTYYSPQIRAYRKAVAQLTGLAETAITSRLAFTSLDAVRLVSP